MAGEDGRETMRLQKFLARAGIAGRRRCEEYIAAGRVSVNGQVVVEMGVQVNPGLDEVAFDGAAVRLPDEAVTIVLNKPAGVFTTMREQRGRACVADLLPMAEHPGLYHVGRLDADTTGILLFSTDGELGNRLLHPSRHVEKVYIAQVKGRPSEQELDRLRRGITLTRGERTHRCAPAQAQVLDALPGDVAAQDSCLQPGRPGTSFVRLAIHEGVKHQVKLMLSEVGHPVVNLHRAAFGPITCDGLSHGQWRYLTSGELQLLQG